MYTWCILYSIDWLCVGIWSRYRWIKINDKKKSFVWFFLQYDELIGFVDYLRDIYVHNYIVSYLSEISYLG